jgi:hypothetical protein
MELKISDEYEQLAIEWQHKMIAILKEKLSKFDVENDLATEIVGEFAFDFAMLHDQEEIRVNGKSYNPRIVFDDNSGNLISSEEESNLHEYAFESTSEAYGE